MLFMIAALVLVLAIAFRQATFGLFSAMIMAMLTICCGVAAMGMHEWVAAEVVAKYWKQDYALAVGLAAPFGIMLIVLRLVADKMIPNTCLVPSFIDRIGGGLCGFFTGMTIVGIGSLSLQLLPLGRATLGFQRVPSYVRSPDGTPLPEVNAPESDLWMTPDRFVVEMTSLVSSQVFSSTRNFYREHPDYVGSMGWATAVPSNVSIYAPNGSVTIIATGDPDVVYSLKKGKKGQKRRTRNPDGDNSDDLVGAVPDEFEAIEPQRGYEFKAVRLKLMDGAARERKHLFTVRQFRLAGQDAKGSSQIVPASAIQQENVDDPVNRHVRILKEPRGDRPIYDDVLSPREANGEVEVVFEVPTGFQPSFLEYKLGARADVNFSKPGDPAPITSPQPPDDSQARGGSTTTATPVTTASSDVSNAAQSRAAPRRRRGGNVRRVTSQTDLSFFGDAMPMELTSYRQQQNPEISRGLLRNGHLVGQVDQQASGTDASVTKFAVPSDKRLLQLNTQFLATKSVLGKALAQAVKVAGNFFVTDENGARSKIIGKYAIADVNGTRYVEVQYFPDHAGTVGGVGEFSQIKDRHFKGDYTLVYLFLVDPGATITDFSTGGSATRADDLRSANLVAPN